MVLYCNQTFQNCLPHGYRSSNFWTSKVVTLTSLHHFLDSCLLFYIAFHIIIALSNIAVTLSRSKSQQKFIAIAFNSKGNQSRKKNRTQKIKQKRLKSITLLWEQQGRAITIWGAIGKRPILRQLFCILGAPIYFSPTLKYKL